MLRFAIYLTRQESPSAPWVHSTVIRCTPAARVASPLSLGFLQFLHALIEGIGGRNKSIWCFTPPSIILPSTAVTPGIPWRQIMTTTDTAHGLQRQHAIEISFDRAYRIRFPRSTVETVLSLSSTFRLFLLSCATTKLTRRPVNTHGSNYYLSLDPCARE